MTLIETSFTDHQPISLEADETGISATPLQAALDAAALLWHINRHLDLTTKLSAVPTTIVQLNMTPFTRPLVWMVPQDWKLEASEDPADARRRKRAIAAIDTVRGLLDLTEESAARILGIARGTLRSWRREERSPYPATTQHLFEVEAVVRNLVSAMGEAAARRWLEERMPDGRRRVDLLCEADGPRQIAWESRSMVFRRRSSRWLPTAADLDEDIDLEPGTAPVPFAPSAFQGPVNRRRRPS